MIRLSDGTLAAVLRGGAPHIGRGGRLDWITSSDRGKTWTKPRTLVDGPQDDRNPAFGQLRDGTLLLAYCVLSGYDESGRKLSSNRAERVFDGVYLMRSNDRGTTWTKGEKIPGTSTPPGVQSAAVSPYGKIVQLSDGTALMAVYYEANLPDGKQEFQSWVYRSKDSGKTWGDASLIQMNGNETALAILKNGDLVAAVRTSRAGFLQVTRSKDAGRTWSTPVAVTQNGEHPADLIQLNDGRLLMTFGERNAPRGVHALVSSDAGATWAPEQHIPLVSDAPNVDCGYPSSIEIAPGKIATIYYQVDDTAKAPASAKAKLLIWFVPRR
jgi:Neuraminidase (sialidase)